VVPLRDKDIIFVSVRAFNNAGGATVVTSEPAIVNAGPIPVVEGLRCVGLMSSDPLSVVDTTGSGTVYAPELTGIGIMWDAVYEEPVQVTWEVRRLDSWALIVQPIEVSSATTVLVTVIGVNYTAAIPLHPVRWNVSATVTKSQTFVPGVSYVAVVTAVTPAGKSATLVTNRVIFAPEPHAGVVSFGPYAEHSQSWLGFSDQVRATWSAFRDDSAGVHHFHVCLLLLSPTFGGVDESDTSMVVQVASPVVSNGTYTIGATASSNSTSNAQGPIGACVIVEDDTTFAFPQATVLAITEQGAGPVLACSVSAVSFTGLVRTAMSSTANVDFERPTPGEVTVPVVQAGGGPDLGSVTVEWAPFTVNRAPLVEYFVAIDRSPVYDPSDLPDDLFRFLVLPQPFRTARLATRITLNSLWMIHNQAYYAIVVGVTAAGTRNVESSEVFSFHAAPPAVLYVYEVSTHLVFDANSTSSAEASAVPASPLSSMLSYNPDSPTLYEDMFGAMLRYGMDLRKYGSIGPYNATFQQDALEFLANDAVLPVGSRLEEGTPVAKNTEVDIDFQSAPTWLSLAWVLENDVAPGSSPDVDHFELQVMKRAASYRHVDSPVFPVPWRLLSHVRNITLSGLRLQEGHEYYAVLRAIATDGVFADTLSDGVTLDALPPCVGPVNVSRVGEAAVAEYASQEWTPPTDTQGVADGTLYLPGNQSMYLAWRSVVDPMLDATGVAALCTHQVELAADFGPLNATFNMTDVFHPYGNVTQADYDAGAAASNATTWEQVHADLVRKVSRQRTPNEAPLNQFTVTVDLVTQAFEAATNTSTFVNITTYSNSSTWANSTTFTGTSAVNRTTTGLFRFADPVCCSAPLPALDQHLEADIVMAEVSSAAHGLLPPAEAAAIIGDVGVCSDFGQSLAIAEGPLLAIGGLSNGVVVSVTTRKDEVPFRYSSNLADLRAESTVNAATPTNERLLCVRAAANAQAVVFAGDDVVKVVHVDRAAHSVVDKLLLNMDGAVGLSVNAQFLKGTMATRVAVSVQYSELSGGIVTLVAMSGRFLITGEGFVAVVRIDDGRQLSSVGAFIQPRTQLGAVNDPQFGTALAMHGGCLASWGPLTGVVLACQNEDAGIWQRALLPTPSLVLASDEAHLFGSSIALGSHVLAVGFPRSSATENAVVFVYHFNPATFSAKVTFDAIRVTYRAPLLMTVIGTGIGQAIGTSTVSENITTIVVGDRLTSQAHVFKVEHEQDASDGGVITDPVVVFTKLDVSSPTNHRLVVMSHGPSVSNSTENSTLSASVISHNLVVQSVRQPGNSSFSHLHVLSYCNPGFVLQRATADDVDVTCVRCPSGSTSLGGRTRRCVNCVTEFAPPETGEEETDSVSVTCAPVVTSDEGGTPFDMMVRNLTTGLAQGREYRLAVNGTTRSGAQTLSASTGFVVDFTVRSCVCGCSCV